MRYIFIILLSAFFCYSNIFSQVSLIIGSGNTMAVDGDVEIVLSGNWESTGTLNATAGTVTFNGSGNQTISNSSGSFNNINVSKSAGDVQLNSDISIAGNLILSTGNLDLNGNIADLGTSGALSESTAGRVKGSSGDIRVIRDLNAPSSLNVAGLGAEISSSANLGFTEIRRGHAPQIGIERYYDIIPTNNSALNSTLVFHYNDAELNGLNEAELVLFRSADSGSNWSFESGSINASVNTITLNGINAFSRWTAAVNDITLPVELTSFNVISQRRNIVLTWVTESELNNLGFEVYRSKEEDGLYDLIASYKDTPALQVTGNSSSGKEYAYVDSLASNGQTYWYKIADVDFAGMRTFHGPISVKAPELLPQEFALHQNYPNPFNPVTNIRFDLPENSRIRLTIYNLLGQAIRTFVQDQMEAGFHTLQWDGKNDFGEKVASSIYIYRLQANKHIQTRKMVLMK